MCNQTQKCRISTDRSSFFRNVGVFPITFTPCFSFFVCDERRSGDLLDLSRSTKKHRISLPVQSFFLLTVAERQTWNSQKILRYVECPSLQADEITINNFQEKTFFDSLLIQASAALQSLTTRSTRTGSKWYSGSFQCSVIDMMKI